ncbi:putative pentatricopeptide repeat-containing protein At3g13770, mitochondrial [Salvia hispanica]|uniref:putative pentatricopeptide repeat-containing protein At3g13770, mitochondrial n=1 Tax=Salvia hispanica TaxID=49212 RepID=UPI0020095741|nr:putative pentatricopeptide repeat-containing protein At3g13770, mitochondrial [Salvia hispanica]
MLRRITQFIHHRNIQTFISIRLNRNFSIHQSAKLHSFPPNSNIAASSFNLNHSPSQQIHGQGHDMRFMEYDALLRDCVSRKHVKAGQTAQSHMIKTSYALRVYFGGRLIVLYLKCGCLADAQKVFDEMPHRNVVSWTAMISGYTKSGFYNEALHLVLEMLRSGTNPNEFTFATVVNLCTSASQFECGRQIHSLIVKSPFESHIYVGSSLLDLYAKSGNIHEARLVFEGLPERDVVSCTAIVSGYAQLGFDQEALDLFCELQSEGMSFNYVTYACVLTALSGLAAFEYGRQMHGRVLRSHQSFYIAVENSLIDMYSKCGYLVYARRIFDAMCERSVISWNAMLGGYGRHGDGEAVVELYSKMKKENKIKADGTTLLTVLSGCSHGGMEQIGLQFFDEVASAGGVDLGIEHYGCIVDLLGRAGQLERALHFVKEMPLKPNAAIWGSLLGACRAHRDFQVGKVAADRLLEIEPENAGNYVMLCNVYALDGRWHEVRKVRRLMKEKAVVKEPGKSWIT